MAKQAGIFPLIGTIGNVTFVRTKDGYQARNKTSMTAERIATEPEFKRTRENNLEFGRAGKAARLIFRSFKSVVEGGRDKRVAQRLVAQAMKALREDGVNARGARTVQDGKPGLLEGFEFNAANSMYRSLYSDYTVIIDRVAGTVDIALPSFNTEDVITAPVTATHYAIEIVGAELDFAGEQYIASRDQTAILPLDTVSTSAVALESTLTPNSALPIMAVLGICFYQEVNGVLYALRNGGYNAYAIVKIDA